MGDLHTTSDLKYVICTQHLFFRQEIDNMLD